MRAWRQVEDFDENVLACVGLPEFIGGPPDFVYTVDELHNAAARLT